MGGRAPSMPHCIAHLTAFIAANGYSCAVPCVVCLPVIALTRLTLDSLSCKNNTLGLRRRNSRGYGPFGRPVNGYWSKVTSFYKSDGCGVYRSARLAA